MSKIEIYGEGLHIRTSKDTVKTNIVYVLDENDRILASVKIIDRNYCIMEKKETEIDIDITK